MNSYFAFLEKYFDLYPAILLKSSFIKDFESIFIIDPSLPINIIKESKLIPFLGINRSKTYSLKGDTLRTRGIAKVYVNRSVLEFHSVNYIGDTKISGVLALPFNFDIVNKFH